MVSVQEIVAIAGLIPGIVLAVLAGYVVIRFAEPIREGILPRLTGVTLFGVRVDLQPGQVQAVLSKSTGKAPPAPDAGNAILARAKGMADVLAQSSVLWVDDNPLNNLSERRLLHQFGVFVQDVQTTAQALEAIGQGFDLVISDMARAGSSRAGLDLIEALRRAGARQPVVIYAGSFDASRGVPQGATGMTNRPDELMHLVMDTLSRKTPTPLSERT